MLSCAAINVGLAKRELSSSDVEAHMRARIRHILATAAACRIDSLVLGAFGCGVFHNDPAMIASLFHHHLTGEFRDAFDVVVFAIPGADSVNARPFHAVFGPIATARPGDQAKH